MKLRTVLFDLDGTLVDSIELILHCFEVTWREHGRPAISREEWLEGVGRPLRAHFADYESDPEQVKALIATYRKFNHALHDDMVCAYDGAPEAVAALHEAGVELGIVTSKARMMMLKGLDVCGFDASMFRVMITSDDAVEPKPHPAPVLAALEQLGAKPEEAAFVGDSVHDMESGSRAGVLPVGVLWGPFERTTLERAGAKTLVATPDDLVRVLRDGQDVD